jgi:hypothetical protein
VSCGNRKGRSINNRRVVSFRSEAVMKFVRRTSSPALPNENLIDATDWKSVVPSEIFHQSKNYSLSAKDDNHFSNDPKLAIRG